MDNFPSFPPQRVVPANLGAEQALLGAIMLGTVDPFTLDLDGEHFADPVHYRIFRALKRLIGLDLPFGAGAVASELLPTGVLEEVGGTEYIHQLSRQPCAACLAREYSRSIKDAWIKRNLIGIAEELLAAAFGENETADTPPPDGGQLLEIARHRLAMLAIEANQ